MKVDDLEGDRQLFSGSGGAGPSLRPTPATPSC